MNKLVLIADVNGAAILRTDGSVISLRSKDNGKPKQYTDLITDYILSVYQSNIYNYTEGMFVEQIIDYNGSKILTHKIRDDIMLLLVLEKRAYLGLTMLNVEGCLQDIDSALKNCIWDYKIPG